MAPSAVRKAGLGWGCLLWWQQKFQVALREAWLLSAGPTCRLTCASHVGFCAPVCRAVKPCVAAFGSEPAVLEPAWVWGFVVGAWLGATSVPTTHDLSRIELGPGRATVAQPSLSSYCVLGQCSVRPHPRPQWDRQKDCGLFRVTGALVEVRSEGPAWLGASCEVSERRSLELGWGRLPSKCVNNEGMLSGKCERLAVAGALGA